MHSKKIQKKFENTLHYKLEFLDFNWYTATKVVDFGAKVMQKCLMAEKYYSTRLTFLFKLSCDD